MIVLINAVRLPGENGINNLLKRRNKRRPPLEKTRDEDYLIDKE
jgi:hypothetical protein